MDVFAQDLRASWRALRQSPRFTAIALVTIALGTGANATVFSFVNALLLRPAAGVADPSSLVAIFTSDYSSSPYGETSYPDYLSLKTATSVFDDITAFDDDVVAVVRAGDVTERIRVTAVAGAFFDVLGLRGTTGRLLTRDDLRPDAPPVMVIGHDLWRRMFGGRWIATEHRPVA